MKNMEQIIAFIVSLISLKIIMKIVFTAALIGLIIYVISHFNGMNVNQMFNQISNYFTGLAEQLKNSIQK